MGKSFKKDNSLFLAWKLLRIHSSRFVASLITAGTVPVAEHAYRHSKEHVRNYQRQDEVPQIVIPGVPGDYVVRIGAAIKAGEGFAQVLKTARQKQYFY